MTMNKSSILAMMLVCCLMLFAIAAIAPAHDMFLKLDSYFLKPNRESSVELINGTFESSENVITRDRMLNVSIAGPGSEVTHPDESHWHDKGNSAFLDFKTGSAGTYVLGVSTAARVIELSAADFNEYLRHDGVVDALKARTENGELEEDAQERYAKHVKAVVQVGEDRSDAYQMRLDYPVEFVPLQNPYDIKVGETIDILFLEDGKPVANQLVYASHESFHSHDEDGNHVEAFSGRTDRKGVIRIKLDAGGRWYVRTILMKKVDEADVNYESKWATLTFELKK